MTASQILNDLSTKPRTVIEADLQRIQQERQRLEAEESALQAFLRWRQMADEAVDGKPDESISPIELEQAPRHAARRSGPSIPTLIMSAVDGSYEPWPISRVIDAVRKVRPDTRDEAVRTALRRLEERKRLFRDKDGDYYTALEFGANLSRLQLGEPEVE